MWGRVGRIREGVPMVKVKIAWLGKEAELLERLLAKQWA